MTGNERKVARWGAMGWIAASFAMALAAGCSLTIDKVGVGEHCRRSNDCLSGLVCIDRKCRAPSLEGTPSHYVPEADAGADAGD